MRSLFLAIFIIVVLSTRKKLIFLFLSPENFYYCKSYFMAAIAFLLMQHMFRKLYLMALVTLLTYLLTYPLPSHLHHDLSRLWWSFKIYHDHVCTMSVICIWIFNKFMTFNGIYRFSSNDLKRIGAKCIKTVN